MKHLKHLKYKLAMCSSSSFFLLLLLLYNAAQAGDGQAEGSAIAAPSGWMSSSYHYRSQNDFNSIKEMTL
jgi:hypothetical protein